MFSSVRYKPSWHNQRWGSGYNINKQSLDFRPQIETPIFRTQRQLLFSKRSFNRDSLVHPIPVDSTNWESLAPRVLLSLPSSSRLLAISWAVTEAASTAQLDEWSGCAWTAFWDALRPARVLCVAPIRLTLPLSWSKEPEPTIPAGWKAGLCC